MKETILGHIHAEHEFIQEALKLTAESGYDLRQELYAVARERLAKHMWSEELSFYRRIEVEGEASELVNELESEHQEVKDLLQKLNLMDIYSNEWSELFVILQKKVEDHCHKEEEELFPEVKEDYSLEELSKMLCDFEEAKNSRQSVTYYAQTE